MIRTCAVCETAFEAHRSSSSYCSVTCRTTSRRTTVQRVCEKCGVSFSAKPSKTGKFCSRTCAQSASRKQEVTRSCAKCSKVFTVKPCEIAKGGGVFCSWGCRGVTPFDKRCVQCDAVFPCPGHSPERRFCSRVCRQQHDSAQTIVPCAGCRKDFKRVGRKVRYCSRSCRTSFFLFSGARLSLLDLANVAGMASAHMRRKLQQHSVEPETEVPPHLVRRER